MVNSDKSTDLRITASYDRPSAGRVKFIPIPLPIPSKEQSQQEELERVLKQSIAQCWMQGKIYFRGREITPSSKDLP